MLKHILFLLFCMAIYANVEGISLAQTKSTQLPDGFFNPEKGDLLDKTEEFPLPDSIYDPETGEYIPVRDKTKDFKVMKKDLSEEESYKLKELRKQYYWGESPPPGGIGAGTTYKSGQLIVNNQGIFYTKIIVYSSSLYLDSPGSALVYTTSTCRKDNSIEVVGIYNQNNQGKIGIWDWSVTNNDPGFDGSTCPKFILSFLISNIPQYIITQDDGGGHQRSFIKYQNEAVKLDNGNPPLWRNTVYFWNNNSHTYDISYYHYARTPSTQDNCGYGNVVAWWVPILETYYIDYSNAPRIKELGFLDSALYHDTQWSGLGTDVTNWSNLQPSNWPLNHNTPNKSYGIGTVSF